MQVVPLDHPLVTIHGAADFDLATAGISPRRLPDWTRHQIPDALTEFTCRMPAGCYLELSTSSTAVELDVRTTAIDASPTEFRPPVFDLVVDGQFVQSFEDTRGDRLIVRSLRPIDFSIDAGEQATVRFADLADSVKHLQIWLPHNAMVELIELRLDADATIEPVAADPRRTWVHYGSSISHCMEVRRPTDAWPVQVARKAGLSLIDLGLGGSCHLDQFAARTIRDIGADVVTMKVGINVANGDTMRERAFIPAIHGFLDTIREGQPDVPIVVISPIFCPAGEDYPGPQVRGPKETKVHRVERPAELMAGSLTLRRMRELLAQAVATRRDRGDANLHYLDGLQLFGKREARLLPDDLHPNPEGYRMIGERFGELVFGANGLIG
jgi:hypothetical protein